ncbi:hypothetical protein ACFY36_39460 [Actinoplanes sp. NPDC000266]
MSQPLSDVAFELLGACVHSLRFAFGSPLDYPYAPPIAESNPPSALYRRVLAASPPPKREGAAWHTGLSLDGKPFQPDAFSDRLAEVVPDEGVPSLDVPEPETVVLDQMITVSRTPGTMSFPGRDHGKYVLSTRYWSPQVDTAEVSKDVDYYGEFRLNWNRPPAGPWVAVSLDGFWPAERDSADVVIPLGACDSSCKD